MLNQRHLFAAEQAIRYIFSLQREHSVPNTHLQQAADWNEAVGSYLQHQVVQFYHHRTFWTCVFLHSLQKGQVLLKGGMHSLKNRVTSTPSQLVTFTSAPLGEKEPLLSAASEVASEDEQHQESVCWWRQEAGESERSLPVWGGWREGMGWVS